MDSQAPHWLALNRLPGLGAEALGALAEGRAEPLEMVETLARHRDRRAVLAGVARDLEWLEGPGRHLLSLGDPRYPVRLRQIADPPPVLFVRGDPAVLESPQVAVVGSRRATPGGWDTAYAFARELAGLGVVITSGLALGVDGAAHRGAVAGGGRTLAVAANGPDRVYPRSHLRLAEEVAAHGALITEFPPGTPPLARHFPRRNRIISGLSLGVLVVEAGVRSGSLITARLAGEQGREVFAVPGPIQSPLARGCHRLIRQGAKLVESVADILEELSLEAPVEAPAGPCTALPGAGSGLDSEHEKVLECLDYGAISVDRVVERSGLTADTVCSILLALELRGLAVPVPGGAYCRVSKRP